MPSFEVKRLFMFWRVGQGIDQEIFWIFGNGILGQSEEWFEEVGGENQSELTKFLKNHPFQEKIVPPQQLKYFLKFIIFSKLALQMWRQSILFQQKVLNR